MNFFNKNIVSIVVLGVIISTAEVSMAGTLRFCAKWPTEFADSSGVTYKEDWFPETGVVHRTAQHSYAKVRRWNGSTSRWDTLTSGFLAESSGGWACLPAVTRSSSNTNYSFEMSTYLRRGDRIIEILDDSATFDNRSNYWVSGGVVDYGPYTSNDDVNLTFYSGRSKQTSMAVVARQVLVLGNTLGVLNNTSERIVVNMDTSDCDSTWGGRSSSFPYNRVCYPTTSSSVHKFMAGHELGHAVSGMNGGPLNANYGADTASNSYWKYSAIQCSDTTTSHNLRSREYIGAAQGEGFAHFFAAALFNARSEYGYFLHYKSVPVWNGSAWVMSSAESDRGVATWDTTRWMANYCGIGKDWMGTSHLGLGTEGDWLQFYWQLWTDEVQDVHFWGVPEMMGIWNEVSDTKLNCSSRDNCSESSSGTYNIGEEWYDVMGKVTATSSSGPRQMFYDNATATGVNKEYDW